MVTSFLQAVNIGSCVNIVSSWAKFEFCCHSYCESNTSDFSSVELLLLELSRRSGLQESFRSASNLCLISILCCTPGPRALSVFLPLPQQWATAACYLGQDSWWQASGGGWKMDWYPPFSSSLSFGLVLYAWASGKGLSQCSCPSHNCF